MVIELTEDELDELKQWGERFLRPFSLSRAKARRIVGEIRKLKTDKKRLSLDLSAMATDCARLQKVLLDIGLMVRDKLGLEIGPKISSLDVFAESLHCALTINSWRCICNIWNLESCKYCVNCGRRAKVEGDAT